MAKDNEIWVRIADFPDYAVSSTGSVKRIVPDYRGRIGLVLKPRINRYAYLTLYRNAVPFCVLVHRLVCVAFHGPAPSDRHAVAHGDGDGTNNRRENLRWATYEENEADKILHGTNKDGRPSWVPEHRRPRGATHGRHTKPECTARGERGGRAKLTEIAVTDIRLDGRPRKVLAAEYGVSVTMIGFIQRGISWSHVPMPNRTSEE
jgi:HNH endonuclease